MFIEKIKNSKTLSVAALLFSFSLFFSAMPANALPPLEENIPAQTQTIGAEENVSNLVIETA